MSRHLLYFISLGLFWGISPSQYRYWGEANVPVSHILVYTGFGLAIFLAGLARLKHGQVNWNRDVLLYSLFCAILMNVPFSLSLTFARHVPTAELALVFSLSPLVNFAVEAAIGRQALTARRLAAVLIGFASSIILVTSRHGGVPGELSWWLLASFVMPLLYAAYNWYAHSHWPKGGTTFSIGAAESFWTGVIALPVMLAVAEPWTFTYAPIAYWSILAATLMWLIERVSFFTLIREKGAAYTAQAVYLSAPAAVIFAVVFYGGSGDVWLWLSLAILMGALWLNNSEGAKQKSV